MTGLYVGIGALIGSGMALLGMWLGFKTYDWWNKR